MKAPVLYQIVKSLDEGEYRFCRDQIAKSTNLSPQYTQILTALRAMGEYSSDRLLSQVDGNLLQSHLSVIQSRLYEMVFANVEVLRIKRLATNNPEKYLTEARFLVRMGLLSQAALVARSGIKLAQQSEDLLTEIALRDILRKALKDSMEPWIVTDRRENEKRLDELCLEIRTHYAYQSINDEMYDSVRKFRAAQSKRNQKKIELVVAQAWMSDFKRAITVQSKVHYYSVWQRYYTQQNNREKALEMSEKIIRVMESNKRFLMRELLQYIVNVSNHVGKLTLQKRYSDAKKQLQKLEQLKPNSRRQQINLFVNLELQFQLLYLNQAQFEEVVEREEPLLNGLHKYGKAIGVSKKCALYYNLGVAHFLLDNMRSARQSFENIVKLGKSDERKDLQGLARILRVFTLLDTDGVSLDHYLRNSKRFFDNQDPEYQVEKLAYNWLKRYLKAPDLPSRKTQLNQLIESLSSLCDHSVLGAEEITFWAMGKLQDTSGSEAYRLHYQKSEQLED